MTSIDFDNLTVDQALDLVRSKIAELSHPQIAVFFAVAGEALLPLYTRFAQETSWGDVAVLKSAIAEVLQTAAKGLNLSTRRTELISAIADVTPGDEFDTPDSTFAQDAAICVDAAVRAAIGSEPGKPEWVWYVLEPAMQTACLEETGYLDLGTSRSAKEWKARALRHPALRQAFESLAEMVDYLAKTGGRISSSDLETLRRLSVPLMPVPKS